MIEIFIKSVNSFEKTKRLLKIDLDAERGSEEILKESISKELGIKPAEFDLLSENGVKLSSGLIANGQTVQICPKVLGGKGGFGSLLRAFGKQITMSTNKDACRDLTGRRIKHVNNEKKIKEFLSKQADVAKQKEHEKKEKADRKRKKREQIDSQHHVFVDPKYDEQKQKISDDLEEALKIAARKKNNVSSEKLSEEEESPEETKKADDLPRTSVETKTKPAVVSTNDKAKKDVIFKDWMGVGDLDVSSSSSDEDEQPTKNKRQKN